MQRFWDKVDKSGDCWVWTAYVDPTGYGRFRIDGVSERAHKIAWLLTHGDVPEGKWFLHKCDNRRCVNPDHIFLGDNAANCADRARKGRNGKLTPGQVQEIRDEPAYRGVCNRLSERFGVRHSTISRIRSGTRRSRIGEPLAY